MHKGLLLKSPISIHLFNNFKFYLNNLKMKLIINKYFILFIVSLTLFSLIFGKIKGRFRKNNQIVMGRPSAGSTVVGPVTEADELPGHSVINVPVVQRTSAWNIPMQMTTHVIPANGVAIQKVGMTSSYSVPLMRQGMSQVQTISGINPMPIQQNAVYMTNSNQPSINSNYLVQGENIF
jgi:hypothetical protein